MLVLIGLLVITGSVGACEVNNISLTQCVLQSLVGIVSMLIGMYRLEALDDEEE